MGYGEYDGGGSVKWHVEHTDGEETKCPNKDKAHGKDKDPKKSEALMAVWINGSKLPTFQCDRANVVVAWGEDAVGQAPPTHGKSDLSSV